MNEEENKTVGSLEKMCPVCRGEGGYYGGECQSGEWRDCFECHGAGYIPTKEGEAIHMMIMHQIGPMLRRLSASTQ
jgi:DnaJ-class molecular chaperone